jgi:hypothetical protein
MNWDTVHTVSAIVVALVGAANFIVMLEIKKEITEAVSALKEWTHAELKEYATKRELDLRLRGEV